MPDTLPFEAIAADFASRTQRIVWCTVATVDERGLPRTRILHPIWEGKTGWIVTGRNSLKSKHLAANPMVSLAYWDARQENVYVEARAEWEDDPAERARIWALFKATPEPRGYNIDDFMPGGPENTEIGLLRLRPWRIEVSGMADAAAGRPFRRIWREEPS